MQSLRHRRGTHARFDGAIEEAARPRDHRTVRLADLVPALSGAQPAPGAAFRTKRSCSDVARTPAGEAGRPLRRGARHARDGHRFLAEAAARGARRSSRRPAARCRPGRRHWWSPIEGGAGGAGAAWFGRPADRLALGGSPAPWQDLRPLHAGRDPRTCRHPAGTIGSLGIRFPRLRTRHAARRRRTPSRCTAHSRRFSPAARVSPRWR